MVNEPWIRGQLRWRLQTGMTHEQAVEQVYRMVDSMNERGLLLKGEYREVAGQLREILGPRPVKKTDDQLEMF